VCRKVPKAMFTDSDHIALAGFLVEAGRMGEAPALAAEAAADLRGISIQGWTGHPGWLKAGRERAICMPPPSPPARARPDSPAARSSSHRSIRGGWTTAR